MSTRTKEASATQTLDASAWIEAAFDALAEGGIDAVRVDPLAKRLGVTRGSFYWHFADRAALHSAMLKEWRSRASYLIFNRLERESETPEARLQRIASLPQSSARSVRGGAIELAVRFWARRDKAAAKAVRHIDRVRIDYFAKLLAEHGHDKEEARRRAFLFYAALMAEALIVVDEKDAAPHDWQKTLLATA